MLYHQSTENCIEELKGHQNGLAAGSKYTYRTDLHRGRAVSYIIFGCVPQVASIIVGVGLKYDHNVIITTAAGV